MKHEAFDLPEVARLGRNYLTSVVDEAYDYLPYWFVQINAAPAYAKHVRVDDSELVASWYEAIVSTRRILGPDDKALAVEQGFKRHLMKSWGPKGLRYHEDYPWSNTNHSSFHEMAYVLSALNRMLLEEPDNAEAEARAAGLVRGMRELVVHRKIMTFWSGDFPFPVKNYEFPNDVYLRDEGWVSERCTGRGDLPIRNGIILLPLVQRWERHGDEVALDLAEGIANHVIGLSKSWDWQMRFHGHVHSAVWFTSGLARLGRLLKNDEYITKANKIFENIKGISSSFGWVPEYWGWHPWSEEYCETCCIKDMIECGFELIDLGFDHWATINRYVRNQLAENQVKDGCFVNVDNSRADADGHTWKGLDKRIVGGWSGGAEPNSISLARFRSIAGCCVGTAPQALYLVWQRIAIETADGITVNFPINHQTAAVTVDTGYPNDGYMRVTAKKPGTYRVRLYGWMKRGMKTSVNGKPVTATEADGCLVFPDLRAGDSIMVAHELRELVVKETVRDMEYAVTWKGSDVVKIDPPGDPIRLYQREAGKPREYPAPVAAGAGEVSMKPTQQK